MAGAMSALLPCAIMPAVVGSSECTTMLSEGEPFFFALFGMFIVLIFLGIAQNMGWLPMLHS